MQINSQNKQAFEIMRGGLEIVVARGINNIRKNNDTVNDNKMQE